MIDGDERAMMQETVRGALADALESDGQGADIAGVLDQLGWLEMLADEPADAVDIVFSALGDANAASTALDDVLVAALGRTPGPDVAVLLPRFASWAPPGRIEGDAVVADSLASARAASASALLVVCGGAAEPSIVAVPSADLTLRALRGIDPEAGLRGVQVACSAEATRLDPDAWAYAVALGRRAVAHQIAGASRAMLTLARTHALEREQFGKPIARFQAVRHRLAEALVAIEALEAALTVAREDPGPETAALAKAIAGRTAHTVAKQCQQVLAGIGFTTEHAFHRYLKRTIALEGLFGTADEIVLDVGRQLLAKRHVPTLIEL